MTRGGVREGAGKRLLGRERGESRTYRLRRSQARRLERIADQIGCTPAELERRIVESWLIARTWCDLGP